MPQSKTKKSTKSRKKSNKKQDYFFIDKTVFFPERGILALGDLHLGYEKMLANQGLMFSVNQKKNSQKEIKKTIQKIKKQGYQLEKIIILGDLKHHFSFEKGEKFDIRDFLIFLESYVKKENLILLKGNHERFELDKREHKEYFISQKDEKDNNKIAFIHGDKNIPKIWDKEVKTIVMGHLHPAVSLTDKAGVKIEKYKTYLQGKWKNKNIIILPSYFSITEGTEVNNLVLKTSRVAEKKDKEEFSLVPEKRLENFSAYIQGEDGVYDFGKLRKLM